MIITRLSASFGALKNDELVLREGLNVIQAPNETGKSTWCAFIRAMLYGIDTADRDKAGYLSPKNRYKPWSGAPMEGEMDVIWNGEKITLRRKGQGSAPMRSFSAVRAGTKDAVPGLTERTAGEALTGVTEPIFERSAFIRQASMAVSQTAELEKRVASLVSGGDETVSYSEVAAMLKDWMNRRQYQKRGLLPACEGEIREVRARIEKIEEKSESLADMRLEAEKLESYRGEFLAALEAVEKREAYESFLAAAGASEELQREEQALSESMKALSDFPRFPTREGISALRGEAEKLTSAAAVEEAARARRESLEAAYKDVEGVRAASGFYPLSPQEAEAKANAAGAAYIEAGGDDGDEKEKSAFLKPLPPVCFAAAVALAVLGAAFRLGWFMYALAAVALAGGLYFALSPAKRVKKEADEVKRAEILAEFGASSIQELNAASREYKELCIRASAARDALDAAEKELADSAALTEAARESVKKLLAHFGAELPPESAADAAERAENALDAAQMARVKRDAAKKLADSMKYSGPAVWEGDEPPAPRYSRAEAASGLKYAERQLSGLKSSLSMAMGELKSLGDPVVLRTREAELLERLSELRRQYDALSLAADALEESNSELQSRFAPLLSERAGEIFAELTGGKYEGVSFDRRLSAEAKRSGESVGRDLLYLSAGASDQLYLALRLAVCETVLPQGDPCPVILDDALASFDDGRMALALDFLRKESAGRQVVLFTCHSREAEYLDGRRGVNILRLGANTGE